MKEQKERRKKTKEKNERNLSSFNNAPYIIRSFNWMLLNMISLNATYLNYNPLKHVFMVPVQWDSQDGNLFCGNPKYVAFV